jgi:NTP pyrophosphatase (non-canonical NTP hydrolase)
MALTVEASELLEEFQWLTQEESRELSPEKLAQVQEEIGDVLIYLVRLADELGIDPLEAAEQKLAKNEAKYPADRVRGSAKKYDESSATGIQSCSCQKKGCASMMQPIVASSKGEISWRRYLEIRRRIASRLATPFFSPNHSQAERWGRSEKWAKNPPPAM